MKRKIAIIGSASSTLGQAPFNDESWLIWALAGHRHHCTRVNAFFEMHPRKKWHTGYDEFFQTLSVPVMTQEEHADIPCCKRYPIEEVTEAVGRKYFASSIGYMLALAIYEHKTVEEISEIGLWGVDMLDDTEYQTQRPNCEYLIGLAQGMGIKIFIPDGSALLKVARQYGEDLPKVEEGPITEAYLQNQMDHLLKQKEKALGQITLCQGAIQQLEVIMTHLRHAKRNGVVPGGA